MSNYAASTFFTAVQIHYVLERDHWVASSLLHGEVYLYDSLSDGKVSPGLSIQMAELYRPQIQDGLLSVTLVPVQQQVGITVCGAFAVANACTVAMERVPRHTSFDQDKLRPHLEKCFELGRFEPFPPSAEIVSRCRLKHVFIKIYCHCKRPECLGQHGGV